MHKLKLYRLCPAQWTTKDFKTAAISLIFRNSNHKKLHAMKNSQQRLACSSIIEEVLIIVWLFAQTTFPLWASILISNMQKKIFCCVLLAGDSKYWKPCECAAMCSQPMPPRKHIHATLKTKPPLSPAERACVVGLCKEHKEAQEINLCFCWKQKLKQSSYKNNLAWQMKSLFLYSSATSKFCSQLQLPLLVCAA